MPATHTPHQISPPRTEEASHGTTPPAHNTPPETHSHTPLPEYIHVAHASDLSGKDRLIYRALETVPAVLAWGTLVLVVLLSIHAPVYAAFLVIAFDLYWLIKTGNLAVHQYHNWKRVTHNMHVDWQAMLASMRYEHIYHMVVLPYYNESEAVVRDSIEALVRTRYEKKRMIVVLASEGRAGEAAVTIGARMREEFGDTFAHFLHTVHPDGIAGEIRGKGPNITYACEQAKRDIVQQHSLRAEDIIVSAFDIDTVAGEQYFLCLTWHFLTTEHPHSASFQPVPFYNNNIWDAPAFSRVAAFSSTAWQMIQQERVEKLTTFSSHAISFAALEQVGFWQKNVVSDDSRIFWNLYFARNADYRVVPISYPVSMDANLAATNLGTFKNIYKQHLRWMWGSENVPYMLFGFLKNKQIRWREKIFHTFVYTESFWSAATAPLIIFLLGWLPIWLGGDAFRNTVLSYNLPYVTSNIMFIAMSGLILLAIIYLSFMPPLPKEKRRHKHYHYAVAVLQWLLVPIAIVIFGALPALHAQTNLALGRRQGFWVTPKHRKRT
jgi:hypothetical protein